MLSLSRSFFSALIMATSRGPTLLLVIILLPIVAAISPSSYLTVQDRIRLRQLFESTQPFTDLVSAHYAMQGLKLLDVQVPKPQEVCEFIKLKIVTTDIESIYHAAAAAKHLANCQLSVPIAQQVLSAAIKPEATMTELYFAVSALKNLGLNLDSLQASKALVAVLKREDSVLSLGYSFYIASQLVGDVNTFFDRIEDVIPQADEVDGRFLQFEGGLSVTAIAIDGAYKLAERANKAPPITADQGLKFANYFLSRKHVQMVRSACYLLMVIKTFTENKFHIPVAITLASNVAVSIKNPVIQVQVCNLLGMSFGSLIVTADSVSRLIGDALVLNKAAFAPSASDKTLYELDFLQSKPSRGFYKISVSISPPKADARLIGTTGTQIVVKVMADVIVENVELSIADRDQTTVGKALQVVYPNKIGKIVEADYHQKVLMKFTLKDQQKKEIIAAHQAFVRFRNFQTQREIIFIAEPDASGVYKFDTDLGGKAKEFDYLSGKYSLELVIGDAVIANPFSWMVAELSLLFQENPVSKMAEEQHYKAKREIQHLFREPEKRPSPIVSNTFTALVLLPVLILFILWLKIGVNVSNFSFSISCIGFHFGLAAIYMLYYCFWMYLDMFDTLKYLSVFGVITFLAGNTMLSNIAAKRSKSSH